MVKILKNDVMYFEDIIEQIGLDDVCDSMESGHLVSNTISRNILDRKFGGEVWKKMNDEMRREIINKVGVIVIRNKLNML